MYNIIVRITNCEILAKTSLENAILSLLSIQCFEVSWPKLFFRSEPDLRVEVGDGGIHSFPVPKF